MTLTPPNKKAQTLARKAAVEMRQLENSEQYLIKTMVFCALVSASHRMERKVLFSTHFHLQINFGIRKSGTKNNAAWETINALKDAITTNKIKRH